MGDADVLKCIRMLTFLPLEQIDDMDHWEGSQLNTAKEILAYELTKLVHGEEEAEKAQDGGQGPLRRRRRRQQYAHHHPDAGRRSRTAASSILDLLVVKCRLAASKSEARRLVQQGGVSVDGEKVTAIDAVIPQDQLAAGAKIKKGKKVYL